MWCGMLSAYPWRVILYQSGGLDCSCQSSYAKPGAISHLARRLSRDRAPPGASQKNVPPFGALTTSGYRTVNGGTMPTVPKLDSPTYYWLSTASELLELLDIDDVRYEQVKNTCLMLDMELLTVADF